MITGRWMYWVGSALCVTVLCFIVLEDTNASGANTQELQDLVSEIRDAERHLQSIKIRGSNIVDRWLEGSGWIRTNEDSFTAWYPGIPNSKARVDFHRSKTYSLRTKRHGERSSAVAFNGRIAMEFTRPSGPAERSSRSRPTGQISPEKGAMFEWGAEVAFWQFSLYGFADGLGNGQRVSEILGSFGQSPQGEKQVRLTLDPDGSLEVQITSAAKPPTGGGDFVQVRRWVLLADQSYAIQSYEERNLHDLPMIRFTIGRFLEPASGVFYPSEGVYEIFDSHGNPRHRSTFSGIEVVANSPTWTDDVFSLEWPDGTVVMDRIGGSRFVIAPSEEEFEQKISEVVGRAMEDRHPDAEEILPPGSKSDEPLSSGSNEFVPEERERKRSSWQYIVSGGLAALGGVWLVLVRRRQKQSTTSILILCGLCLAQPAKAQRFPYALREIDRKAENCGLAVTAFTIQFFTHRIDTSKLARVLQIGEYWERPPTLKDLKVAFEANDLSVNALRQLSFDQLLQRIESQTVCIAHLNLGMKHLGHYVGLVRGSTNDVFFFDPGHEGYWLSRGDLRKRLESTMSGFALFVSLPLVQHEGAEVFSIHEGTVELERSREMLAGNDESRFEITVENDGAYDVTILSAQGACQCFRRAFFSQGNPLASGETDILVVAFDREEFRQRPEEQTVEIGLDSAENKALTITILSKEAANGNARVTVIPSRLEFGVHSQGARIPSQSLDILLPIGARIKRIIHAQDISVVHKSLVQHIAAEAEHSLRVETFEVNVDSLNIRDSLEHIEFRLEGAGTDSLFVPLKCRVESEQESSRSTGNE